MAPIREAGTSKGKSMGKSRCKDKRRVCRFLNPILALALALAPLLVAPQLSVAPERKVLPTAPQARRRNLWSATTMLISARRYPKLSVP